MTTHWNCLECQEAGSYEHTAKTGDSGPAWKHGKETNHATNSHTADWAVICGARETRPDGNYECVRGPVHPNEGHYWVRLATAATKEQP